MAISACLHVRYTDDGCSDYRCLACGKGWECRSSPKYDGWKFCPHCGDRWEKFISGDEGGAAERRKQLRYEAACRSREAFERRYPALVFEVIETPVWGDDVLPERVEFSSRGWPSGNRGFLRYALDEITHKEFTERKSPFSGQPIRRSYRVVARNAEGREIASFPLKPRKAAR